MGGRQREKSLRDEGKEGKVERGDEEYRKEVCAYFSKPRIPTTDERNGKKLVRESEGK